MDGEKDPEIETDQDPRIGLVDPLTHTILLL